MYYFFGRFPMAGEVFDRLASLGPIEIHWIFLIFLILDSPGQRPGGVAAHGFPSNFYEKTEVNLKRDHGSIGNHHKIMHTSAKHYFEVVWAHMGACRAVGSRFSVISGAFPRFWTPRPAPLAPSRPSRSQAVPGRGFGRFYKKMKKSRRVV